MKLANEHSENQRLQAKTDFLTVLSVVIDIFTCFKVSANYSASFCLCFKINQHELRTPLNGMLLRHLNDLSF